MIIVDQHQKELDKARALYRRRYNRAYNLSEQGFDQKANALLAQANARWEEAQARFRRARGEAS